MIGVAAHNMRATYAGLVLAAERARRHDPTQTTMLRRAFEQSMRARFTRLRRALLAQFAAWGPMGRALAVQVDAPVFEFQTAPQKVEGFMRWLRRMVDLEVLTLTYSPQIGTAIEAPWTNVYIADAYQRGVIRARYELTRMGAGIPSLEASGGISAAMGTPFHADRVGLLYIRAFDGLRNITASMDALISRVLAQGMAEGEGPRAIARRMVAVIDGTGMGRLGMTDALGRFIPAQRRAEMLARTEIIRAHHLATVHEYENWAVQGVRVQAEYGTAGYNVCEECASLEGKVFSLAEVRGLIPRHPNCRCFILPVLVPGGRDRR